MNCIVCLETLADGERRTETHSGTCVERDDAVCIRYGKAEDGTELVARGGDLSVARRGEVHYDAHFVPHRKTALTLRFFDRFTDFPIFTSRYLLKKTSDGFLLSLFYVMDTGSRRTAFSVRICISEAI